MYSTSQAILTRVIHSTNTEVIPCHNKHNEKIKCTSRLHKGDILNLSTPVKINHDFALARIRSCASI